MIIHKFRAEQILFLTHILSLPLSIHRSPSFAVAAPALITLCTTRCMFDYSFLFLTLSRSRIFLFLFVNPKFAFLSDFHHLLCEPNAKIRVCELFLLALFSYDVPLRPICAQKRQKIEMNSDAKNTELKNSEWNAVSHWFLCHVFSPVVSPIPSCSSLVRLSDSQTDIQLSRHIRRLWSFGCGSGQLFDGNRQRE